MESSPMIRMRMACVVLVSASALLAFAWWKQREANSVHAVQSRTRSSIEVQAKLPIREAPSSGQPEPETALQKSQEDSAMETEAPPAFPDPPRVRYKPRPENEWQGMLVDLATQPPCLDGAYCGLARACIAEVCTACERDSDCGGSEVCVLDHCLLATQVGCRSTRECPNDSVCMLSGYSSDPRGNAAMNASCVSRSGGAAWSQDIPAERAEVPGAPRPAKAFDGELARARKLRAAQGDTSQ